MRFQRFISSWAVFCCGLALCSQSASLAELKKSVAAVGRLDFKSDVPVRYLDRAQMKRYVEQLFEKDYPDELAQAESEFLFRMGFSDRPIALKPLRRKIILENVGGMYNEKTRELLAVEEYRELDMLNTPALVHEFRHAIQDQHFGLARLLGDHSDYDDRRLAALAAIEGDATLVMILQLGLDPDLIGDAFSADNVLAFSAAAGTSSLSGAPAVVKHQLLMPYLDGLKFSRAILKKRSWKGLTEVFRQPPQSSEQILHPQKYLLQEKPMAVRIGYRPAHWRQVHSGVIGEFFLNVLLAKDGEPGTAAAGWGGDFHVMYRYGDSYMLLWEAEWDLPADCDRFASAFRGFIEDRFRFTFRPGREKNLSFLAGDSADGYFFLYRHNSRLFYARSNDRGKINEFISGGMYD
jgi:hypothetical protein